MNEVPPGTLGVEAFLGAVRARVEALGAHEARALASAIAERHQRVLGEDEGDTRRMLARVRATRGPVARAQLDTWTREIQRTREAIDPDRVDANDKMRALGVIERAVVACTEGSPPDAPFAVALAALASRALRAAARDAGDLEVEQRQLAERWAWDAVQDEARWLAAELRLDGGAPQPAPTDAAPPAAEASRTNLGASDGAGPRVLSLPLSGRTLRFVGVDHDRKFRVELDGRRSLLRTRDRFVELRTAGEIGEDGDEAPWQESTVADLSALLAALDAGAVRREEGGRVIVEVHGDGAHFRQNEWITVAISLAREDVVQIETTRTSQDESYY